MTQRPITAANLQSQSIDGAPPPSPYSAPIKQLYDYEITYTIV